MLLTRHSLRDIQLRCLTEAEYIFREKGYGGVRLSLFDQASDHAWNEQWRPKSDRLPPNGGWDWPSLRSLCERKYSSMGVAIWDTETDTLLGLAWAKINQSAVVIKALESTPDRGHVLKGKITFIFLLVFRVYKEKRGLSQLWIWEPANDDLVSWYERFGFSLEKSPNGDSFMLGV
ncbi:MAG: hypothetical protein ACR2RF_02825 [Geminicoccaceae bacterium]